MHALISHKNHKKSG